MFERLFYSESTLGVILTIMGGVTRSVELLLFAVSIFAILMPSTFYFFMWKSEREL